MNTVTRRSWVSALIWRGATGEVLLVQRGREPSLGMWAVPGGLVEIGETLVAALLREVAEETGLHVRLGPSSALSSRSYAMTMAGCAFTTSSWTTWSSGKPVNRARG
ncbi:MAG: NUDIX domain-containing protein [Anaerolineae bacterium]|nr:MAG: NUDIX domain-containing protein [Anaerolineae bacterium]